MAPQSVDSFRKCGKIRLYKNEIKSKDEKTGFENAGSECKVENTDNA